VRKGSVGGTGVARTNRRRHSRLSLDGQERQRGPTSGSGASSVAEALVPGSPGHRPGARLRDDATVVRELCAKDPELRHELWAYVAEVIGSRLRSARVRLLDLYAPYGAGDLP
jgi:hypothetical protein